jgi:hypothetical protein
MALPLEVFEERYLIMMANLLKTVQARFGVVLIEHQLGAARRCPENDPLPSGIAGRRTSSSLFSSGRRTNQAAYTGGLPWPLRDGRHWPDQSRSMLDAVDRGIPPAFLGGGTQMRCVAEVVDGIEQRAWVQHIQRLVVLGNLPCSPGCRPRKWPQCSAAIEYR